MSQDCLCDLRVEHPQVETSSDAKASTIRFNVRLVRCPLHEAAHELLDACKQAFEVMGQWNYFSDHERAQVMKRLEAARRKVEGGS
jgi:hypothetical protein